jgi:REP element-mobilizing transposase RayT
MRLFKSREPNLIHYVTAVTYQRVPVFTNDYCCDLLIECLAETRLSDPFKLIGYVIMPDHFHLLANPLSTDITRLAGKFKGRVASRILKWLRAQNKIQSLAKLALRKPLASGQTHAVWQPDFSAIDIWSHKFIRQKLNYIHMNPVRAGLCDHPAKWRWSSYHAYFPHEEGAVPIEVDWRWLWSAEEIAAAADKSAV